MNIIETNLQFSSLTKRGKTNRMILHHSGVTVLQSVEIIHNYHKNTRGYAGIGYHFYVRKDGTVYRGRPEDTVGAHAYGANSDSIGICAEGDYNTETMSEVQKNAIKELVAYLKAKYGINTVVGHRDTIATSCPGKNYPFDEIVNGAVHKSEQYTYKEFVGDVQKATGAKVDRIAGPETLSKTVTVSAKKNSRHVVVKPIQKYLYVLGYTEVGEADGIAGKKFTTAVNRYQKEVLHYKKQDGEITAKNKMWKSLLKLI